LGAFACRFFFWYSTASVRGAPSQDWSKQVRVQLYSISYRLILLAAALVSSSGCCSQLHHLPDECAAAVYECDLARLIHNVCSCEPLPACASRVECGSTISCGTSALSELTMSCQSTTLGSDCEYFAEDSCESYSEPVNARIARQRHYVVGPPPERYQPPMPPKFLPVPARPVFSQPNVLSLPSAHPTVEVEFGSQLNFPGVE